MSTQNQFSFFVINAPQDAAPDDAFDPLTQEFDASSLYNAVQAAQANTVSPQNTDMTNGPDELEVAPTQNSYQP
ncbi:MAG: hypothetical protein KIT27_10540 [Legionellales bacterium]|nr:hypothetical protein [Legionellales bacterium]